MNRRVPFLAVAVASLLAITSGSALATIPGTPDAAQTGLGASMLPETELAQTFVPTISGALGTVEIYTSTYVGPTVVVAPNLPPTVMVQITTTSGNLPTSTVLATQSVTPLNIDWTVVTFSTPANVIAGTMYAIVVTQDVPSTESEWDGSQPDLYGPGAAYVMDTTWKTPAVFPDSLLTDFAFQTFITVAAATPPPTAAPTAGPTAPPTSTGSNNGDMPSNPSFLLIFAGLALAAAASVVVSQRRRQTQR
jgi:hypothetical protein